MSFNVIQSGYFQFCYQPPTSPTAFLPLPEKKVSKVMDACILKKGELHEHSSTIKLLWSNRNRLHTLT